jgi:hypothetical protein
MSFRSALLLHSKMASAAEVLPALETLCLENRLLTSVIVLVAARRIVGRPVTLVTKESEFRESLKPNFD